MYKYRIMKCDGNEDVCWVDTYLYSHEDVAYQEAYRLNNQADGYWYDVRTIRA